MSARICGGRAPIRAAAVPAPGSYLLRPGAALEKLSLHRTRKALVASDHLPLVGEFRWEAEQCRRVANCHTKRKWFQVTRFPALLTAGMHVLSIAIESAGRFASQLPDSRFRQPPDQCLQARRIAASDRGRSLVTAFRSPATAPAFSGSIPGSTFPACYFASYLIASAARSAFRLRHRSRFAPVSAASSLRPVAASRPVRPAAPRPPLPFGTFTSLRIKAFNRLGCQSARLPNPPDFLSLPAAVSITRFRLRINVPGPLRFRRLAVPQTSWNLIHYAPESRFSVNAFCAYFARFSSTFILLCFE